MADPAFENIVPSLSGLSYKVFMDEIICQASPASAKFVRKCIKVWATVMKGSEDFRKSCIMQLNEHCFTKNGQTPLDVCTILDCVLDSKFTELEIRVPYHLIKSLSALLSVIAHRCPQLKKLDIQFCTTFNPQLEQPVVEIPVEQPNSKLNSLTSISLYHHYHTDVDGVPIIGDEDQPYVPILGIIAKRCPVLINLSVRGLRLCIKRDLLELLLGDYVTDKLTPFKNVSLWSNDVVLKSLRVPQEFLTPLCSTLQKIELLCLCSTFYCLCNRSSHQSALSFAVAHLLEVQNIQCGQSSTSSSKICPESIEDYRVSFEIGYREAAAFVGESDVIGFPAYLSGIFKRITSLTIPIDDIEMMRDVNRLCPELNSVIFIGPLANITDYGRINLNYHDDPSQHSPSVDATIGSILNSWPKVEVITFYCVNCTSCISPILKAIGAELYSLVFHCCKGWGDLSFLNPCTKLEQLHIYTSRNSLALSGPPADLDSNEFLPNLTELASDVCLGKWSPLLESKSTLTTLTLRCCHIGTVSRSPALEWKQVPQHWMNMERLRIDQCTGMTMAVVLSLVPQLEYLEVIELPTSVRKKETDDFVRDVERRLKKRKTNLKAVSLCRTLGSGERCSFQST